MLNIINLIIESIVVGLVWYLLEMNRLPKPIRTNLIDFIWIFGFHILLGPSLHILGPHLHSKLDPLFANVLEPLLYRINGAIVLAMEETFTISPFFTILKGFIAKVSMSRYSDTSLDQLLPKAIKRPSLLFSLVLPHLSSGFPLGLRRDAPLSSWGLSWA